MNIEVARRTVASDAALASGSPRDVRLACRSGAFSGQTSGLAPGHVQGNLAILPQSLAADFLRFCHKNPKPCPVIGVAEAGDPHLPELGADLDLRTDLPRYRVWKDGMLLEEPTDITPWWRDDLVAFVIGCSFSFEEALLADGIPLKHIARGSNVPMWRTSIPTEAAMCSAPRTIRWVKLWVVTAC